MTHKLKIDKSGVNKDIVAHAGDMFVDGDGDLILIGHDHSLGEGTLVVIHITPYSAWVGGQLEGHTLQHYERVAPGTVVSLHVTG